MAETTRTPVKRHKLYDNCADCGAPIPTDEPLRELTGLGGFCSDACTKAAFQKAGPYVMHL
jgi:hypothetical protein